MDYEEILLQITDVLKAHNRYHMNAPDHEQAVKAIRDIVTPKGEWEVVSTSEGTHFYGCSECQFAGDFSDRFCRRCGARMESDV